jgi:hypothetical protein
MKAVPTEPLLEERRLTEVEADTLPAAEERPGKEIHVHDRRHRGDERHHHDRDLRRVHRHDRRLIEQEKTPPDHENQVADHHHGETFSRERVDNVKGFDA